MKHLMKRGFAVMMALALCLSLLPVNVFAAEAGNRCPKCETGTITQDKNDPKHLICDSCADFSEYVQESEPLCSHDKTYVGKDNADGTHELICTNCTEVVKADAHSYVNGVCECGAVEPKAEPHEHSWSYSCAPYDYYYHTKTCSCGEKVYEECTTSVVQEGANWVKKCTLCGQWHEIVSAPTCTHENTSYWNNGETHSEVCKNCKEVLQDCVPHYYVEGKCVCGAEESKYVPPVPDDVDQGAPCGTCPYCGKGLFLKEGYVVCPEGDFRTPYYSEAGDKWCEMCSDYAQLVKCGGYLCYDRDDQYIKHIVKGNNCVDVNIHDHECDECHAKMVNRDWYTTKEPTCVNPGAAEYKCTYEFCWEQQKPEDTKVLDPLDHLLGKWEDNNPTENVKTGTHTNICTRENCDHEKGYTNTEPHNYGDDKPLVDGNTLIWICKDCGHKYAQEANAQPIHVEYVLDEAYNGMAADTVIWKVENAASLKFGEKVTIKPDNVPDGYELYDDSEAYAAGQEVSYTDALSQTVQFRIKPIYCMWQIKYVYADGTKAADDAWITFSQAEIDSPNNQVKSPEIEDYTADKLVVGPQTAADLKNMYGDNAIIVTYTKVGTHVVRWVNWNGAVLETGSFNEGEDAPAAVTYSGAEPTRPSDGTYTYTFRGWSAPAEDKDGNVTYTALFNATLIRTPEPDPDPEPPYVPPTTPDPEPVVIDEPDVPLVEEPVLPEPPEEPVLPELPEEPIVVDEPEIPLVELPEEVEIEEPAVPLAEVPQTGDASVVWLAAAALPACGLGLIFSLKKREGEED